MSIQVFFMIKAGVPIKDFNLLRCKKQSLFTLLVQLRRTT
jgi:hypothetical protein